MHTLHVSRKTYRRATAPGNFVLQDTQAPTSHLCKASAVAQYVVHFPRGEKYVSIMKQADSAEDQAGLDAERNRLRALVSQQLAEAAMLAEPDEGVSLPAASATALAVSMNACTCQERNSWHEERSVPKFYAISNDLHCAGRHSA